MNSPAFMDILRDVQHALEKTDQFRTMNRSSPFINHITMVADGVNALIWVTLEGKSPSPSETAAELFGGAQVAGNKVLVQK
jgi:adenylyl cyclase-associated protein